MGRIDLDTFRRKAPEIMEKCFDGDGRVESVEPIATGHFNTSFRVRAGGRDTVVRVAPPQDDTLLYYEQGMMKVEAFIHPLVLEQTDVPLPEVLIFDDSREIIDADTIVMQAIPGRTMGEVWHTLSPQQQSDTVRTLGRYTRQLHDIQGDRFGYVWPNEVMEGDTDWPAAFADMTDRILADNVRAGSYNAREAEELRGAMDRNMESVDRPEKPSLLHMDLWHQNILLDESGRITAILDIDRAVWAPPEFEFAVLDTYALSTDEFFDGYGAARDLSDAALVRRAMYIIVEIIKYPFIRAARNHNPGAAAHYKHQINSLVHQFL